MTRLVLSALLFASAIACRKESSARDRPRSLPQATTEPIVMADSLPLGTTGAEFNQVAFSTWSRQRRLPRFEEFLVSDSAPLTPAPVDLFSDPKARRFATVLRAGTRAGPNFAGRYTVISWGCGSPCVELAVVDARTGHVYMHPDRLVRPPIFRRDSRLLAHDPTGFMTDTLGHPIFNLLQYFEWDGTQLRVLDSLSVDSLRIARR